MEILALMSAKLVMKSHIDIKNMKVGAIRTVVEALISCGVAMSIAGSSRPCSGSEHMFAHALDLVTSNNALHGEKCGVGTIISVYLQDGNWKKIKKILGKIGAPTNAKDLGVDPKDFIRALIKARKIRPERYTILNQKKMDQKTAEKVAKITSTIV
jgi:glycerol-1-phosphate dehydrogenase [NAD(P)+]